MADLDFQPRLSVYCERRRCTPKSVWDEAYTEGHFTMDSFLDAEELRLGWDLSVADDSWEAAR